MNGRKKYKVGPTIRDVAKMAGVSLATASRALKNQSGLSEQTRQQVIEAAENLGYDLSNLHALKIKRVLFFLHQQHSSIAHNDFYFPVMHGVEQACRKENIAFSYCSIRSEDNLGELVQLQEADAVVCAGFLEPGMVAQLGKLGKPVVLVDHFEPDFFCVNMDNVTGAYLATQHLIAMGRKRVAFIMGQDHYSIHQRLHGYRQALMDAGRTIDEQLIVRRIPADEQAGAYPAMQQLLALRDPPDAVFTYNDATAMVAIQACADAGLSIPDDLAFVGFDDTPQASHSTPSLTTVHVDKERLGAEAVKHILHPNHKEKNLLVPVRLTIRQSSKSRIRHR